MHISCFRKKKFLNVKDSTVFSLLAGLCGVELHFQRITYHVQAQQDNSDFWIWWPSWTMAVYCICSEQQLFSNSW